MKPLQHQTIEADQRLNTVRRSAWALLVQLSFVALIGGAGTVAVRTAGATTVSPSSNYDPITTSVAADDTDGDGTPDDQDGCPFDVNKIAPGVCGCGVPDFDTDADGVFDCIDGCPFDAYKTAPGACGCGVLETPGCAGLATFPVVCGELVTTFCPDLLNSPTGMIPDPAGFCVRIVDPRNCPSNGANCITPMFSNEFGSPSQIWNIANLGPVFAVCLDDELTPNIYVAATTVYGQFPFGPGGAGAIYKINGLTGQISPWITTAEWNANVIGTSTLPNGTSPMPNSRPGLGDICFDPFHRPGGHKQFFVSNFEDGKIYRILDDVTSGQGIVVESCDPHTPASNSPGFEPLGELIWGLNVINSRTLLYSGWLRDSGRQTTAWPANWGPTPPNPNNALFTVSLSGPDGTLGTTYAAPWRVMPRLEAQAYSNPVSDITSIHDTIHQYETKKVLIGERTMANFVGGLGYEHAHKSRVLEFVSPYPWNITEYRIGNYQDDTSVPYNKGTNCAGGVAYDDHDNAWATGDNLLNGNADGSSPFIYGLQRVTAGGNPTLLPPATESIIIDVDQETTGADKSQPGDVEFACPPAAVEVADPVFCTGDDFSGGCPCGNFGDYNHGCPNSQFTGGAFLHYAGLPNLGIDTLVLEAKSLTGPGLFFQANGTIAPITFGDGMLCAAVGIIRLGVDFPVAGVATFPSAAVPTPVHIAGAPIAAGDIKYYQCWYRDSPTYCTPATFNTSNGVSLTWTP